MEQTIIKAKVQELRSKLVFSKELGVYARLNEAAIRQAEVALEANPHLGLDTLMIISAAHEQDIRHWGI